MLTYSFSKIGSESLYMYLYKCIREDILTGKITPGTKFLRHTFATHALAGGVDAKTLSGILGHTNASFTLDTYTHVTTDMQRNASTIVGSFMDEIMLEGDDTNR